MSVATHIRVVDTGAIIRNANFFHPSLDYRCTTRVIDEVTDKKGREHLEKVREFLRVDEPDLDSVKYIREMARITGDLSALSATDVSVLALAVKLHKEGGASLRSVKDATSEVSVKVSNPSTHFALEKAGMATLTDISDAEGEWIGEENFSSVQADRGAATLTDLEYPVSCMTGDFAMQNVLLVVGIPITTVDGRQIRQIRKHVQLCTACKTISQRHDNPFCASCGYRSMRRVPLVVDASGQQTAYITKGRPRLRGTIFKQPIPTGGKHQDRSILYTEDMIYMGGRDREARHKANMERKARELAAYDQWGTEDTLREKKWSKK